MYEYGFLEHDYSYEYDCRGCEVLARLCGGRASLPKDTTIVL